MRGGTVAALSLMALIAACGDHGATQYSGAPPPADQVYGQCAFCHNELAEEMVAEGGHANLQIKCERCHDDLTPGMVGCGHRSIPRCPDCHSAQITHHDPAVAAPQQCTICHTPHGSPNLRLIRTEVPLSNPDNMVTPCTTNADGVGGVAQPIVVFPKIIVAGSRDCTSDQVCASTNPLCGGPTQTGGCAAPIEFDNQAGRADGSFASVSHPGTGVCEVCHTTTRHYTSDGMGQPHFTTTCTDCHTHPRSFLPN